MTAATTKSIPDPQQDVVDLLSDPAVFGAGCTRVDRVETHVSLIFMGPERVYKLKRQVVFPYLDFSTAEKRLQACEAEVRINRRTAPSIYKGVVAVTREVDGTLTLGGQGEPVDWVVEMARFDEETLFDRLAVKGALKRGLMEDLADAIAEFHSMAEPSATGGGRDGMATIVDSNDACFAQSGNGVLDAAETARLTALSRQALDAIGPVLDQRREDGRVRHCHGDLHLRNICMVDGRPTLFDAIEFNDTFATIDVLYDLAFLLMDLDHRGLRRLASIALNRYLDVTGEGAAAAGGLRVLALFHSVRAAIRCHVDAAQVHMLSDAQEAESRAEEARDYLARAIGYLEPTAPVMVAVGGLSGSGKSRMARELAPHLGAAPGARVVRSDATRKRIQGVALTDRLGEDGYSPEATEHTFQALYEEAAEALAAGQSVIADAVFARPDQRVAIAGVAADAGVPFTGLWLEAPADVMAQRLAERKKNVSDADARVLALQRTYDLGTIEWARVDSSGPRRETLARVLECLGLSAAGQ